MESLITNFYNAFKHLDAETMVSHYHNDVVFEDPAFGILNGEHAKNMWRMLCESQKGKNFVVNYSDIEYNDGKANATWEAHYIFSKTGRPVHNIVKAHFEFKEDKIIKHTDDFNLHKWSKQALGLKGLILGKTAYFKSKLNQQTNNLLARYEAKM